MKRLRYWSLSVILALHGAATFSLAHEESPMPVPPASGSPTNWEQPPAAPAPPGGALLNYNPAHYPSLSQGSCGGGLGFGACCEREYSHLDSVWSGYCSERRHRAPSSVLFGWLHIDRNACGCNTCPTPPMSDDCGCHAPAMPLEPHMPTAAPIEEAPSEPVLPKAAPEEVPADLPPAELTPPTLPMPTEEDRDARGWLPIPRFYRFPL